MVSTPTKVLILIWIINISTRIDIHLGERNLFYTGKSPHGISSIQSIQILSKLI